MSFYQCCHDSTVALLQAAGTSTHKYKNVMTACYLFELCFSGKKHQHLLHLSCTQQVIEMNGFSEVLSVSGVNAVPLYSVTMSGGRVKLVHILFLAHSLTDFLFWTKHFRPITFGDKNPKQLHQFYSVTLFFFYSFILLYKW